MITGSMELRILLSVFFLDGSTTNHLIQCVLKQSLLLFFSFPCCLLMLRICNGKMWKLCSCLGVCMCCASV